MGQEINHEHFSDDDWVLYRQRLQQEMQLLRQQYQAGVFSSRSPVGGFEIEGWLVDQEHKPVCKNEAFFKAFDNDELVSAELAKFNIELNNEPFALQGSVFHRFENSLKQTWEKAVQAAQDVDAQLLLIGVLPTAMLQDFSLENMSSMHRYHALNQQILALRHPHPITLDIAGRDHLKIQHDSVMLEAATTSFQIHMQVPWQLAHHYYNASLLASAPVLAAAVNSPYLFGHDLWAETRVPLFEQAVSTNNQNAPRVGFGERFMEQSILECFDDNLSHYEVLLPELFDQPAQHFNHLRLHNGVIWRWNRPLIGFDEDGTPHFRIEHRTLPAGPTIVDMIANAVFYYGLAESLVPQCQQNNLPCDFKQTKANFYQVAQQGLDAIISWDGAEVPVQILILEKLLPMAEVGLQHLKIDQAEISHYLGIIEKRVSKKQTGADWQRAFIRRHGDNQQALMKAYGLNQQSQQPVSEWT